jgi:succinate-acetate transporter protein
LPAACSLRRVGSAAFSALGLLWLVFVMMIINQSVEQM